MNAPRIRRVRWAARLAVGFGLLLAAGAPAAAQDRAERAPADVLLVTSAELAPAWAEFAAWKTRQGKRTRVVSVAEVAEAYPGRDVQERLRACIHEHARRGGRWVVLGGDSLPGGGGVVPDRDTAHPRLRYRDIPTDLYYVSEGSWDADGDGVFGEWRDDRAQVRYESLAAIGRVPVRSAEDVAAFTRKVIRYESAYPAGPAQRLLYTCAVPQANYKADLLWDRNLGPAWEAGQVLRFFVDRSPWDQRRAGDYDLSPRNWVERLNGGAAGKMHMHGHGHLPGWVLEGHALADGEAVAALRNEAPLVMTTVSCFTGHYDDRQDPSIAESMLRHPGGGAVVVVAPSRPGVPIFPGGGRDPRDGRTQDGTTGFLTRFWVHGLRDGLTTGEALARAQADYAERAAADPGFHWVLCEVNLLGDPTLDMRARDPFTPAVEAPHTLPLGRSQVVVEAGAPGLTVCLWKGDEVYEVVTSDGAGRAEVTVHPRTAGELLLTVCGPSANTVTRTLTVGGEAEAPARGAAGGRRWFK